MVSSLRDFIEKRRAELLREIEARRKELTELDAAERAISSTTVHTSSDEPTSEYRARSDRKMTIQEMALDVLADKPQGASALEIARLIKEKFNVDVPRTSMSPQLSRLKTDSKLVMESNIWRVPQCGGQKSETPTGDNPESVS